MTTKKKTTEIIEKDEFCVYLGPTIKGVLTQGQVFKLSKKETVSVLAATVKKHPAVERLIVTGTQLPMARVLLKKPGTLLHNSFIKLANSQK